MNRHLPVLLALLVLGLTTVGAIWAVDELADPPSPAATADAAAPEHPGSGRVFALFVDSLRVETATSPALMPHLAALRARGASATVETVYDAITAPAVQAAFTGRAHFRVLGFVQNFLKRSRELPSLFSQLRDAGGTTEVWSDGKTFLQFGSGIAAQHPFEAETGATIEERQDAQALAALAAFQAGAPRLAIVHVTYLDYVAHAEGTETAGYRAAAAGVDRLVAELDARLAPEDTFVVFGDHGHTAEGRHALGLPVPTFFAARGPAFRAGENLGRIHITAYRYLLSWALKLPLDAAYNRERFPSALATLPGLGVPKAYAEAGRGAARPLTAGGPAPVWPYLGLALAVGLGALVWRRTSLAFAAPNAESSPMSRDLMLALVGAALLFAWGLFLAANRERIHEPFYPTIYRLWAYALVGLLLAQRRFGLGKSALFILAVPSLFLYPTVYRYGAPAIMAPVWICWSVAACVAAWRSRGAPPSVHTLALGRVSIPRALPLALGIILLVQPFYFTDATNFIFTGFKPLAPELAPRGDLSWAAAAALAALLLLRRPGAPALAVAAAGAAYTAAIVLRVIPEGHAVSALLALVCAVLARRFRLPSLTLLALLAAHFWLLRTTPEAQACAVMLFAALRLSLLLLERVPPARRDERAHLLLFTLLAVLAAGWETVAWSPTNLEWRVFYDLFPARVVEEWVWLFMPLMALRYAIPLVVARVLFAETLAPRVSAPAARDDRAAALALKLATLTALALGLGQFTAGSGVYLEAAGELGLLLVLGLGLL